MAIKLQLRNEPSRYIILSSAQVTLGRDVANDFVIDAPGVSDFHAEVSFDGTTFSIVDLLSGSGTFVNSAKVSGSQQLQAWDVIRLGSEELELNDPRIDRPSQWALVLGPQTDDGERRFNLAELTSIGRDPSCDIVLESDLLSRRHAELRVRANHLEVVDLGSVNGTFVNDRAIQSGVAFPNDELRIEPYRFKILGPEIETDPAGRARGERTMVNSPLDAEGKTIELGAEDTSPNDNATEVLDDPLQKACLVDRCELLKTPQIALKKSRYSIGRSAGNDIQLNDSSVSKSHARLLRKDSNWVIEDLGSSNGLVINGELVTDAVLCQGDEIRLGRAVLEFRSS